MTDARPMADARLFSAACERNRGPILAALRRVLPPAGEVLEIASGTGMHAVHFARHLPHLTWRPSDADEAALASVRAWRAAEGAFNLAPPVRLDVTADAWPVDRADAVFNANMIHISPWATTEGLLRGAARVLPAGGPLVIYGPFRVGGAHTAESNAAFDRSLAARDPAWGVRDLEAVVALAEERGLELRERLPMPANNQLLVLVRA